MGRVISSRSMWRGGAFEGLDQECLDLFHQATFKCASKLTGCWLGPWSWSGCSTPIAVVFVLAFVCWAVFDSVLWAILV